jgi:hypothetical protein
MGGATLPGQDTTASGCLQFLFGLFSAIYQYLTPGYLATKVIFYV